MTSPSPIFHRWRSGVTLVELLVTLLLIAFLTLLGISVAGRVRQQTQTAECLSRMRQVGMLILRFSAENNQNLLPALTLPSSSSTSGSAYVYWLDFYGYLPKASYDGLKEGIMSCPSRKDPGGYAYNKLHYAMNYYPGFRNYGYRDGVLFHKITRITQPHRTLLLAEVNNWYQIVYNDPGTALFPHNNKANVFFTDGHMKALPPFFNYTSKGDPYPFW